MLMPAVPPVTERRPTDDKRAGEHRRHRRLPQSLLLHRGRLYHSTDAAGSQPPALPSQHRRPALGDHVDNCPRRRGAYANTLSEVHSVSRLERASLALRKLDLALDAGEECLWAHALGRSDAWILCGPDKASLRCGVRLGFRQRLVSLERLLEAAGHRPRLYEEMACQHAG